MAKDKYAVTGATGFLGNHLCSKLAVSGEIYGVGRNLEKGRALEKQGIRFVEADIKSIEDSCRSFKGMRYVVHCAALSSVWGKYEDFYATNVIGTRNVVQACLVNGVERLVYISTPSIYFEFKDKLGIKEDYIARKQVNSYSRTKLLAEEEIALGNRKGLETIIIRPRAIFGENDNSIFPRIIRANESIGVPLINEGSAIIDITYVGNVVNSILLALQADKRSVGRAYNITNGQPMPLYEILTMLFQLLQIRLRTRRVPFSVAFSAATGLELVSRLNGKEPLLTRYSVGVLGKSETLDISRARNELGYEPKITIQEGLQRFATWWKSR